jgi:hypothetical protein
VQKKATIDAPPTSNYFNDDKKLRVPLAGPITPSSPPPTVSQDVPHPPNLPSLGPDPTQALLQQLVYQNAMMMTYGNFNPSCVNLSGAVLLPRYGPPTAAVSPGYLVKLPHPISLEEFCLHYDISDADRQKLEVLKVCLGDQQVEMLEPEYWKDVVFSKLGWGRFLKVHQQFLKDIPTVWS